MDRHKLSGDLTGGVMNRHNKQARIESFSVGSTRVINRGNKLAQLFDPYHVVLNLTWPRFFGALLALFLAVNLCFGLAYYLVPGSVANARIDHFWDYFFFSIETLATVGYGAMSPANFGGHVIASTEIMLGMATVAFTTGLIFARFAKPKARILFSKQAVIRRFDGKLVLMFRIANERYNRIVDASATVSLVRIERLAEGDVFYRIHELPLVRPRSQVFSLTWMLMHEIDEASPLNGMTAEDLTRDQVSILVSVTGHDETVAASVYALHDYEASAIVFDGRFADVLILKPDGSREVDLTRFHDIEVLPAR